MFSARAKKLSNIIAPQKSNPQYELSISKDMIVLQHFQSLNSVLQVVPAYH